MSNLDENGVAYLWGKMKKYVSDNASGGGVSSDYTEYRSEGYGFSAESKADSLIKEFTVSNGIYRIEAFTGFAVSTSAMTALYVQSDSTGVMTSECYVRSTMSSGGGMSASCFVDARGKTCTVRVSVYQGHTSAVSTAYNIQVYKESSTILQQPLPIDYIVERAYDSTTGWYYEKYNSGWVDMVYLKNLGSIALTSKKADGVYANDGYITKILKYPFEFQGVYYANCNISSNGYTQSQIAYTSNVQCAYRIWSSYPSTPSGCVIMIRLCGKLK